MSTVWDERLARTHGAYPATSQALTVDVTRQVVDGEEVLARLLRDVLSIDNVEIRRGQRPRLDADTGRRLLHELQGQDYTILPFHTALRTLAAGRSLENLKRRTSLSKATLSRLMTGTRAPHGYEIEAVADAFGKRPVFFAEYRALMFAEIVRQRLAADPDRSAALVHHFGLGR